MTTVPPGSVRPATPSLEVLMANIRAAREEVRVLRVAPVAHDRLLAARRALLGAMEAYADALVQRRLPIPPRLRDELRLQRDIPR